VTLKEFAEGTRWIIAGIMEWDMKPRAEGTIRPDSRIFILPIQPKRLRAALEAWRTVARKIADIQSRVILALMYFVVMAPFALIIRLFKDPLELRRAPGWHPLPPGGETTSAVTAARQQF